MRNGASNGCKNRSTFKNKQRVKCTQLSPEVGAQWQVVWLNRKTGRREKGLDGEGQMMSILQHEGSFLPASEGQRTVVRFAIWLVSAAAAVAVASLCGRKRL